MTDMGPNFSDSAKREVFGISHSISNAMTVAGAAHMRPPKGQEEPSLHTVLEVFYTSRSLDNHVVHQPGEPPGAALCNDYGQLMAELSSPLYLFTNGETEIAGVVSYDRLSKRETSIPGIGTVRLRPRLTEEQWLQAVTQATTPDISETAQNYAALIAENWRWALLVPKPHATKII
jgi:hypothetical protein